MRVKKSHKQRLSDFVMQHNQTIEDITKLKRDVIQTQRNNYLGIKEDNPDELIS